MANNQFHRHFATKGKALYWILFAYLVIGAIYPITGFAALICMIAPVAFSFSKGRWWCGNACPRGNMMDRLISKYSPHRPIPKWMRTRTFRLIMIGVIFTMFGIQLYYAWGDWEAMGRVFWNIVLATTIAGVILAFVYAPRTWCSFCPMGTMASWAAPQNEYVSKSYKSVHVEASCQMKCKSCARVCPMQLTPYESRGKEAGYRDADCIKCGKCTEACPTKVMRMSN